MRRFLVPILLSMGLAVAAPPARADTAATCADLQATLTGAAPGEAIALSGTCVNQSFTLPSTTITLRAAGPGDGFDGSAGGQPILQGTNVGTTTIRGLTFRHGHAGSGAAVSIVGASAPQILGNTFSQNTATSMGGALRLQAAGAAVVAGNVLSGNTSTAAGGAAEIEVGPTASLTLSGNSIQANSVAPSPTGDAAGGGVDIRDAAATGVTIADNQMLENTIGPSSGKRLGAGLYLAASGAGQSAVTQARNVFDQNSIASSAAGEAGGAGEWIVGARVDSTRDAFTSNTISRGGGEGAGVGVEGALAGATPHRGELHASDLVSAGNKLAVGGRGAGIYAGGIVTCTAPDCPSVLELNDSTVAGNCVEPGAGSRAPGVAGSGDDILTLRNSIVYDHQAASACTTTAPLVDIAGFGSVSAASTDACQDLAGSGAPLPGAGNICADPVLDSPQFGGFHETAVSPTIDAGSNAVVPAGLSLDADGQPRVTDGNGDGSAFVDMGADESPGKPLPVDTTPPKVTIVSRTVRETATQRVHIRVRCVEQTHCGGTLTLTTNSRHKRYAAGSGRFNILGGHTRTVILKLRKKARSLLNHRSSIRVTAKATARDLAGNVGRTTRRVTVKARRRPRR
jgi:Right handed beta helix region